MMSDLFGTPKEFNQFIGLDLTNNITSQLKAVYGVNIRVIPIGKIITAEYRDDRTTVWVDRNNKIHSISRG
jgi:hypothetical protein